jgi:hypothetical protein
VLKKPNISERPKITATCCHGKNIPNDFDRIRPSYSTIVYAITIPTITPIKQLARIRTIAS